MLETGRLAGSQREARHALGDAGKLAERQRGLVAASRAGASVRDLDVVVGNAEHTAGERDDLCPDAAGGHQRGRAGVDRLAAGKSADALRDRRRIADRHDDVLDRAADLVGDDLRQCRARALPLRGSPGRDRDLAVGEHPHRDALERTERRPKPAQGPAFQGFRVMNQGLADGRLQAPGVRIAADRQRRIRELEEAKVHDTVAWNGIR